MLAESAHPDSQSVSWVGWAHSRALAELHDVHLITRAANREAILAAGWREGRDFDVIDTGAVERQVMRAATALRGGSEQGWTTLMAMSLPAYYAFEALAWRRLAPRIAGGGYDVVHRITPVSPTMPSLLARHCRRSGVPFVLGPINGGLPWPREFPSLRAAEREWLSPLRALHRAVPGYASTRRSAAAILAGSLATLAQVPGRYRDKCFYLPENGIDPSRFPHPAPRAAAPPLRALFVGRLVPYKGCDIAIDAAAPALRDGRLQLDIVGDGPELASLRQLAERHGVGARVRFMGRVAPGEVVRHYQASDLFLFPSLREFGGGVVLEALTMGVPPVVVDYGGPGELVDESCGVKVPLAARPAVVAAMRAAIRRLIDEPGRLAAMAAAARSRVDALFTWQRKAQQVDAIYDWVSRARPDKPAFPFLQGGMGQRAVPRGARSQPSSP